jgi:hypothetical protein
MMRSSESLVRQPGTGEILMRSTTASQTGEINKFEVPYRLVILNFDLISAGAKKMAADFVTLLHEISARGVPVEVDVRNSR